MFLKNFLEKIDSKKIRLYVDMDGVIADYDVGEPRAYDTKRPLFTSIAKLEEISKDKNIELYILSITRLNEGIEQKNIWLDKYAPFFKKENRIIISREANGFEKSEVLKENYVKSIVRDESKIVIIDDDPLVLHRIKDNQKDIVLLKDTALVE